MRLSSLGFLLHEAWLNIRRNGLMSLATLGTVTVALTVLGASLWTIFRLSEYAQFQPRRFDRIDLFLLPDVSRERAETLRDQIAHLPGVARVRLIPREQAWADLQASEPLLTEALEENPLPDKLEVEVRDIAQIQAIAHNFRDQTAYPDVERVVDAGEAVRVMLGLARVVKVVGGSASAGLFIATLFLVYNTIRLTVFARRREIRTMQLVGATPGFIRLPLLLEGLFHGVVGALLASGILLLCAREVSRFVASLRSPLIGDVPSLLSPWHVPAVLVALGALIGLVGSYLAIRRFLRPI
ncbi:MAG: permease-like cell division protein FtsX [Chloroherpetonaceae bacterium]|nr:ABC transporter permease [Chthonomonadaceae bacterium]MDW8208646.1 permease-like cell division protein FtsX [Chloroherpetonaceae bacterium]